MQTRQWVLTGLFAALLVIFSQILIPLPIIPLNFALLAVFLCGALLPHPLGVWSVVAYVLLGLVGLPVFAGFRGGLTALFGKTGGYILGYIPCVWIVSFACKKESHPAWRLPLACLLGTAALYILGTVWFMHLTGLSLSVSLSYCVLPFIAGDVVKILLACLINKRLHPALKRFL